MYGRTFDGVGLLTDTIVVNAAINAILTENRVFPKIQLGPGAEQGVILAGLKDEVLAELDEKEEGFLNDILSPYIECTRGCGLGLAFVEFDLSPTARDKLRALSGVKGYLKNRFHGLRNRHTLVGAQRTAEGAWENTYAKRSLKEA